MGKSQETQQLAVGMSGKWAFGGYRSVMAFSLEEHRSLMLGSSLAEIMVCVGWE
jgi:hypothetical protein